MSIASLYPSINPSLLLDFANSKVLDPRITFSRTTTATYYDGVTTAKAEENLFTYSQEFDNAAWGKVRLTVTANSVAAPDGTTTAETIDDGTAGGDHYLVGAGTSSVPANSTYTLSCYAKEPATNSRRYFGFTLYSGSITYAGAIFDLQTQAISSGAEGSGYAVVSSSCTSVGNGWYRCVLTVTTGATSSILLYTSDTATITSGFYGIVSYTGSNKQLYIWGAQLEQRSSATAYTATTTQAITNYIPVLQTAAAGQARFDHNPTTGESLGLLIEEARTNSQTYSQDFTNAVWNNEASRTIITANTAIAPDGTLTADKFAATTDNNVHRVYNSSLSISAGVATTISWFAKRDGYDVAISDSGGRYSAWFNLSTGTATVTLSTDPIIASMVPVGNGWYRCVATITPANSGNFPIINSYNGGTSFVGNGFSGFFIWGYQFEVGAFATSYIPTVASSVTRNADAASMTGTNFSSWFNNGEGTLYGEGVSQPSLTTTSGGNAATIANIDTGTTGNALPRLARNNGGTGRYAYYVNGQYEAHFTDLGTWSNSTNGKLIGVYKANDFAASFNGGAVQTDNTGVLGVADRINIGRYASDGYWNSTIKKIAYYPIRVTNAQLQALTV